MSKMEESTKKQLFEIEYQGKKYRYVFHKLSSLQAETANTITEWYNDAVNRQKDVNLKEVLRSDLGEVKDAIVAHLVREVSEKKEMLPYNPDEARTSIKTFMHELYHDDFGKIKDGIIKDFFFNQGKSHLATRLLRDKQKTSLTTENILLLAQLMNSQSSTEPQEKKNSESLLSKAES